jgi:hypothetical protein
LTGILPPVRVTTELPAVAVSAPPHVVVPPPETSRPLGSVSVNGALRLAAVVLGLLKVIVRVEVPPALMVAGLKALLSVGGTVVPVAPPHAAMETVLESIVTAPFRARALPATVAPVVREMLVSAKIFPTKLVAVPIVAELPTCQKTLHGAAPLVSTTDELLAVVRVLTVLNTHTAAELPCPSRVSAPVSRAEDVKQ